MSAESSAGPSTPVHSPRPRANTIGTLGSLSEGSASIFSAVDTPSTSYTAPSTAGSSSVAKGGRGILSAVALGKRRQVEPVRPGSSGGGENAGPGSRSDVSLPAATQHGGQWSVDALVPSTSSSPAPSIRFAPRPSSSSSVGGFFARGRQRPSSFLRSAAPSPEPTEEDALAHGPDGGDQDAAAPAVVMPMPARQTRPRTQSLSQLSLGLVMPKRRQRLSNARALGASTPTGVQSMPVSPWASSVQLSGVSSPAPSTTASSTRRGRLRTLVGRLGPSKVGSTDRLSVPSMPLRATSPVSAIGRDDAALRREPSVARPARTRSHSAPLLLNPSPDGSRAPTPVPVGIDWFDMLLPRELRIYIMATLVRLYVDEHETAVEKGTWRGAVARETRWTGRAAGLRNLIALTRVSRTWETLALDGQLWSVIDVPSLGPGAIGVEGVQRIARSAGPFITSLDLRGMASIDPSALFEIMESCATYLPDIGHETSLVALNLAGCHGITTQALSILLNCSPHLALIDISGLRAVTASTCSIIAARGSKMIELNVSRCPLLDARALLEVASGVPGLRKLRASRVKVDDQVFVGLLASLRQLVLLDVSFSVALSDVGFNRLASTLSAQGDRRLGLKLLNVSGCRPLTSQAFKAIAGCVPLLDSLEAALIGPALRDEGLVPFFASTPLIRRVDLGGAIEITDRTISALTAPRTAKHGTGTALEHLVISGCSHVSDRALMHLIRNCARLRVLEVDNTNVGDAVVREFVRLSRRRKVLDAELTAFDSRHVSHRVLSAADEALVRPRHGVRGFAHQRQDYHDRDAAGELNECDPARVVLKSFYTWRKLVRC